MARPKSTVPSVYFRLDKILKLFDVVSEILSFLDVPMLLGFKVEHRVVIDGLKQAMNYWVPWAPYRVIPFSF